MEVNVNINNIDSNGVPNISNNLKNFINTLNNLRKELIKTHTKDELDRLPFVYSTTNDEELKRDIENKMLIYHFPIALVFLRKYAIYIKSYYIDDLFQHCLFVIINTLRKFNPNKKVLFHTYLSNYMFGEVLKFIDSTKTLKYNYYYLRKKDENIIILNESDLLNYVESDDPDFIEMYNHYFEYMNNATEEQDDYYSDLDNIKSIILKEIRKHYSGEKAEILESILYLSYNECHQADNLVNCLSKKYDIDKTTIYDIKRDFIKKLKKLNIG